MTKALILATVCAISLITCSHAYRTYRATTVAATPPPPRQVVIPPVKADEDFLLHQLRRKVAAEPRNVALRLELAQRYETLGNQEVALEHFQAASVLEPSNGGLAMTLAKAYRRQEMAGDAAATLTRFVAANPDAPGPYWSWAGILADEAGQYVEAEEFHRQAIYRSENAEAFLHNNLGHNLLLQGRRGDAANEFRKALALQPRLEIARNNLAVALSDPAESLARSRGNDPAAQHNNLAAEFIEQGKYVKARLELQIALSYRPDYGPALKNLSILSSLDGKPPVIDLLSKDKLAELGPSGSQPASAPHQNPNPQEKTNP
ncbi:MAG: hypothetical protein U0Q16_13970 [Bryobacteraceae bacterium]